MTTTRSGDLSLEKARILTAYETSWRQWRAFIAEQKDEQRRRAHEGGAFADPLGVALEASAHPIKANLPGDVRQELMRALELRRQETQARAEETARATGAPPPDRDAIFAQVLDHIDQELAGNVHPSGRALVWHEGRLHEFNHRRVLGQTSDADYQAAFGGDGGNKRRAVMVVAGVGAALLVVLALLVFNSFGEEQATATAAPRQAQVGKSSAPLWDVALLGVGRRQLAVPFARAGYPLLLCTPPESMGLIEAGVTLTLTGTASVRTYLAQPNDSDTPHDLLLADCTQSPPVPLGAATLVGAATSTPLDAGLLLGLRVVGPDSEPAAIPADRMRVELTVAAATAGSGAATLVLADGSRVAPSGSLPNGDSTTLAYLVPLTTSEQPAGWEVSRPDALPALLPLTLPPPASRARTLRDRLEVVVTEQQLTSEGGQVAANITLSLHNRSAQPLALQQDDLTAFQGNVALPITGWPPPTLAPGATATVAIAIVPDLEGPPIELALANWRGQLRWK